MRASVGDVRRYFEVFGQEWTFAGGTMERRPAVVGLHGGPGLDGTKLRYQLEPLADLAQVVVPDQRGHGRSDRGAPETWNLSTWAADVENLCDALAIERLVVLGVSFGGLVAQQYAATYPEHPAGLVLVSTGPRFASFEESIARFGEVGGEEAAEIFRRNWEAPSEEADAQWERVIGPLMSLRKEGDFVDARLEAARTRTIDVNWHWISEGKTMDLRERLGAVRCRTLVILGEHDPLVADQLGQEIADAIPHGLARLELVADASDKVFGDNPTESYRLVRDFLADLA